MHSFILNVSKLGKKTMIEKTAQDILYIYKTSEWNIASSLYGSKHKINLNKIKRKRKREWEKK